MKLIDLTGQKFSRWTVLSKGSTALNGQLAWLCRCECGSEKEVKGAVLKSGGSKSCGCWQAESRVFGKTIHGLRQAPEYAIWCHIKSRCNNPEVPEYPRYGGRGIKVCQEWMDFEPFYKHMGPRPSEKHTIDRFPDNDGNYEPGNCRWSTMKEQQRNRSDNRIFTFNGVTAPLAELCELHGCKYKTVHARIQKGVPLELAMTKGSLPKGPGNALAVTVRRLLGATT